VTAATLPLAAPSIRTAPARRKSPNRRRAVARIVIWHTAAIALVVALPILF
jgi:hypothetical protein